VRAEDFVAGAQDGVRVGDVDADGVDAVLGLGVAAPPGWRFLISLAEVPVGGSF
jgi:hypothetical protein